MLVIILLMLTSSLKASSNLNCGQKEKAEALQNFVRCEPRDQLVALKVPDNMIRIQPRHVFVKKCQGSCWAMSQTCLPTSVKNITLSITGEQ